MKSLSSRPSNLLIPPIPTTLKDYNMKCSGVPFRENYRKASDKGIPSDRYATDYVEFEDGDYRLGDLKQMGWTMEVFRHGQANELYLFYEATNQPKEREGGGLKFVALENISGGRPDDDLDLKVFAYGYGYEEGIRHIYYGSGHQKGYFYCPSLVTMVEVLKRVEDLTLIFCRNADAYDQVSLGEENVFNH